MKRPHASARPSHYNKEAESYDSFNESNSKPINELIEAILKKEGIERVLDLTCGTGSQVFWLAERGYDVTGVDINSKMLKKAIAKAKHKQMPLKFLKGDMRSFQAGEYDAVLTIFNAIGHLTKEDFEKAVQNIYRNLRAGGLYVFDIFNLTHLLEGNNITSLTIDWQEIIGDTKVREIQYSTISREGVLTSYDTYYEEKENREPKVSKRWQTLQTYTAGQLRELLERNGFKILKQCDTNGSTLSETSSPRLLTIAKKIS